MVVVLGRDEGGNMWVTLTMPEGAWREVEKGMEGL
jgi:hypothetical protein